MPNNFGNDNEVRCSFCGKPQSQAKRLISGNGVYICDECVELCMDIIADEDSLHRGRPQPKNEPRAEMVLPKPQEIKKQLDEYVVGQDEAKMTLAVAVYNHYKRIFFSGEDGGVEIAKSNVLLLGPTGVGKTYLAQTLAKLLDVPFAIADATTLTEAGYVGEDVESILSRLLQVADYDVALAERGIVFIDEFDKIAEKGRSNGPDVSREGVQRDILPIVEGATVNTKYGLVKTDHILFIAAGAFHVSKPSDLIPELQGRFPIRVELQSLTVDDFRRILTEPNQSLVKQYKALLETDGVTLEFTDDGIDAIAEYAYRVNLETENIGARRLHTILEKILEDVAYEAPDIDEKHIVVNKEFVSGKLNDVVQNVDLSHYIL